jgi:hypothetical protein
MVDERGWDKNQICNGGRMAENEMWDNYRFILPGRASHFRYVRGPSPYLKIQVIGVVGEIVAADVAFLTCQENIG